MKKSKTTLLIVSIILDILLILMSINNNDTFLCILWSIVAILNVISLIMHKNKNNKEGE